MAGNANYATWNANAKGTKMAQGTFSNGNLTYAASGEDGYFTTAKLSHKCYCELRVDSLGNYGGTIGLVGNSARKNYDAITFQFNYQSGVIYYYKNGSQQSNVGNIGGTVSAGSIVMMAYDPATYKWWVGVNGTWRNSGDPANGTNPVYTGSATMFGRNTNIMWGGWKGGANGFTGTFNFGQDSTFGGQETAASNADENGYGEFKYSVPAGFLANCSASIPIDADIDPAQTNSDFIGGKQFGAVTYSGNGGTNAITGLGFQPDFIWIKQRDTTSDYSNGLVDSTRGRSKVSYSSRTQSEATSQSNRDIVSFDSDGFTLGEGEQIGCNSGSGTYVAWAWRANGGTTSANSVGDINSVVQTNAENGFSVVTYTGGAGANLSQTVGHGLGVKPEFIIHVSRTRGAGRWVQHIGTDSSEHVLQLGSTSAQGTYSGYGTINEPTNTVFTVNGIDGIGGESADYVAYVFASIEGHSSFGRYVGSSDSSGPYVHCGFRPVLVAIKRIDYTGDWIVSDAARRPFNDNQRDTVKWNSTSGASTGAITTDGVDFFSDGFQLRASNTANEAGATYVYCAWGSVPFRYNNTF